MNFVDEVRIRFQRIRVYEVNFLSNGLILEQKNYKLLNDIKYKFKDFKLIKSSYELGL